MCHSRLDTGLSTTERLYEYLSARHFGEHLGDCSAAYPQCPFSLFQIIERQPEIVYDDYEQRPELQVP